MLQVVGPSQGRGGKKTCTAAVFVSSVSGPAKKAAPSEQSARKKHPSLDNTQIM